MDIKNILKVPYSFSDENPIPRIDIELLLSRSINQDRVFLLSHTEYELTKEEFSNFNKLIKRRMNFEPVSYILGHKEFYGYDFKVSRSVLTPRPETEELVKIALEYIRKSERSELNLLEIGTGSGCIPISIALEASKFLKDQRLIINSIDISKQALDIANENLNTYQKRITNVHIKFEHLDFFDIELLNKRFEGQTFDLIISNPPYIETKQIPNLMKDVQLYEPLIALDGGSNGMKFFDAMLNLEKFVTPDTRVILEGLPVSFIFKGSFEAFKKVLGK